MKNRAGKVSLNEITEKVSLERQAGGAEDMPEDAPATAIMSVSAVGHEVPISRKG